MTTASPLRARPAAEIEDATTQHQSVRRRSTRLMVLAMLALQIVWVFAVPPFRGSDEFDHVYKAAAVARGDWFPSPTNATRNTGAWLDVPGDLAAAARDQCVDLPYTEAQDCYGTPHGDSVRIASGAGRYHPLFYALVGTPALPFHGYTAMYVMRLATVLITWLLFAAAVAVTRSWARTPWPTTALAVAATPVLIYSSSVVAPNGVEMAAGLALWTSLTGLLRGVPRRSVAPLLLLTAVAGSLLVTVRSLGPLWCFLVVAIVSVAAWPGWQRVRALLRDKWVLVTGGVVGVATLLSCAYISSMGSLNVGTGTETYSFGERVHLINKQVPLWILQTIAAFPLRNEPTRATVYACYVVLMLALFALGVRAARGRLRVTLFVTFALGSLVPYAIQFATFNSFAGVWQGRYALPFTVGIAVLAGLALDQAGQRVNPRLRFGGLLLFTTAQVVGPLDVMRKSLAHPLADASHWVHPPRVVLALALVAAAATLWWAATRRVQAEA